MHRERIEQYIGEGRTVSGGDVNPPDKPGYIVLTMSTDDAVATAQLNSFSDKGYEVIAFDSGRVILGNYFKKS